MQEINYANEFFLNRPLIQPVRATETSPGQATPKSHGMMKYCGAAVGWPAAESTYYQVNIARR